jgi:hypothetical protein
MNKTEKAYLKVVIGLNKKGVLSDAGVGDAIDEMDTLTNKGKGTEKSILGARIEDLRTMEFANVPEFSGTIDEQEKAFAKWFHGKSSGTAVWCIRDGKVFAKIQGKYYCAGKGYDIAEKLEIAQGEFYAGSIRENAKHPEFGRWSEKSGVGEDFVKFLVEKKVLTARE